jgi:hypothetical protein
MEQEPVVRIVTVLTETVQTGSVIEEKLTAKPELAVAPTANGETPKVTLPSAANEMVCDA